MRDVGAVQPLGARKRKCIHAREAKARPGHASLCPSGPYAHASVSGGTRLYEH
jgi:hypothetical protein